MKGKEGAELLTGRELDKKKEGGGMGEFWEDLEGGGGYAKHQYSRHKKVPMHVNKGYSGRCLTTYCFFICF